MADTTGIARHYLRMPMAERGMRVGLFGGSFNPPHEGHVHVAEQALKRLQLHQVWWLVTPGNPLKDHSDLASLAKRIKACEAITADPRMKITAFEAALNSSFTIDTLQQIHRRNAEVNFVWIMGADSLGQFHRWERWREIAALMPFAVVDRPGATMALHGSAAVQVLRPFRVGEDDAARLPGMPPPAWTFLHGPRNSLSSTALRAARQKQQA